MTKSKQAMQDQQQLLYLYAKMKSTRKNYWRYWQRRGGLSGRIMLRKASLNKTRGRHAQDARGERREDTNL
jgi:hypothetical protein